MSPRRNAGESYMRAERKIYQRVSREDLYTGLIGEEMLLGAVQVSEFLLVR